MSYTAPFVIDAVGISLIFAILPSSDSGRNWCRLSVMVALYAVLQFVFAPVLVAPDERLGRRAVL